jgi:hypothetical protein
MQVEISTIIVIIIIIIIFIMMVLMFIIIINGSADQRGLLVSRGFVITHDEPQSVGLLWTSDQLVAETST